MKFSATQKGLLAAFAAVAIAAPAFASLLKTDNAKSNVSIVFKQMNVPVDAKFKKFSANIDYNQAKPETSKASVEIELNSFDLGDPQYNAEVQKKDWFNSAQFPKASFSSSAMKANGKDRLDVSGVLSIKGKSVNVSFPVTIKQDGNQRIFDGVLPIKRLAFNIGEGEWKDTGMVADEVTIKFHVVTNQ